MSAVRTEPVGELDPRFSSPDATPLPWSVALETKYGSDWRYLVRDGVLHHAPESLRSENPTDVWGYEIKPTKVFAFGRGGSFAQTRWRF